MNRPVFFLARNWHGHGGMQRLNRDVSQYVGGSRSSFLCLHPHSRSSWSMLAFCFRSLVTAMHWRPHHPRVHVGDAAALPLGMFCAWLGHASLSVTACGLDVVYPAWWYQVLIGWCLRRCDQVICISHATADEVRKRGVSDDRITVIPCGINPSSDPLSTDRDSQLLLTVGRLVQRKGVAWFLEQVFPRLLAEHPDVRSVIVGDGPERRRVQRIIRSLHLGDAVVLLTHVTDADRQVFMGKAGLFVAPNIHIKGDMEGFGIVCLEAADAGLPVAAANIEGLRDAVIERKTGRFFEPGNADDCVRVIETMLAQPIDPSAIHTTNADHFAWDRLVPLYHNVFDR